MPRSFIAYNSIADPFAQKWVCSALNPSQRISPFPSRIKKSLQPWLEETIKPISLPPLFLAPLSVGFKGWWEIALLFAVHLAVAIGLWRNFDYSDKPKLNGFNTIGAFSKGPTAKWSWMRYLQLLKFIHFLQRFCLIKLRSVSEWIRTAEN